MDTPSPTPREVALRRRPRGSKVKPGNAFLRIESENRNTFTQAAVSSGLTYANLFDSMVQYGLDDLSWLPKRDSASHRRPRGTLHDPVDFGIDPEDGNWQRFKEIAAEWGRTASFMFDDFVAGGGLALNELGRPAWLPAKPLHDGEIDFSTL